MSAAPEDVFETDLASLASPGGRAAFVRAYTRLEPVPMVGSIRIYTATELLPIWRVTSTWLDRRGLAVPFWCVPWAGGQALARWVLDHPDAVRGRRVLDFGAGSGLVAIAAAKAGAAEVRAVDVDPIAIAACELNAEANDVRIHAECTDLVDGGDPAADVVLAGDVWYELDAAARFARFFQWLAGSGVRVLTGDPGRHYAPSNARELAAYDVPTSVELESSASTRSRVLEVVPVTLAVQA